MFTILALQLSLTGCDSLKNKTDRIAVECGMDQKNVGQHAYIKLLSPDGNGYESTDISSLKIDFKNLKGEVAILPLTTRACIVLPHESGLLRVVDSRNGDSLSRVFEPGPAKRDFLSLNLAPKPEIQANLACPEEGIFASESIKQPLYVNVSGEIAGLDIRLDVFDQDNNFVKTLYRKAMGITQYSLPADFDIRDMKEGTYLLKIYGHHLAQGLESRPQLLSSEKNCRLNVLRGTVYVGGLDNDRKQHVYQTASLLPWTIQSPFDRLYVCRENRLNTFAGSMQTSPACKAQNVCNDPANYKEVVQVATEDSGVFNYFVFAQNKAGKRSEISCQTIIVSDAPPTLSVTWAHDDLKKPGSILRKPYAILKAEIETHHDLIQESSLVDNLSCKVDFEIKGKNSFTEKGVICTEGRCQGKSLADFVPCDRHLAFTLVDALNQPMLMSSRLRLTVRSTDGAGHSTEAQASLWINQSTWIKEPLPYIVDNKPSNLISYSIDPSSDVLAIFHDSKDYLLAALTAKGWVSLKTDDLPTMQYNLARARDGSLRIARSVKSAGGSKVEIFGYKDTQLIPLSNTNDQNLIPNCINFLIGPENATYCMGSTLNEAFRLIDAQWVKLPLPNDISVSEAQGSVGWRILQDGSVAAISSSSILLWDHVTWKKKALGIETKAFVGDLIEDFKGRLWVYIPPIEPNHGLYRIDGDKPILYPSPLPLTRIYSSSTHPASASGLNYFAADLVFFDFSSDSWIADNYPINMFPDLDDRQSTITESQQAFVLLSDKGIFEGSKDLVYWPSKSLGYRAVNPQRDKDFLYFVDSRSTSQTLVRMKSTFVSSFDSDMTGTADLRAVGAWDNAEGQTVMALSDGSQLIMHKDHIQKAKGPAQFKEALQITALSLGRFCVANLFGLWLYDPAKGSFENFVTDTGTGSNQQCTEDSTGKLWWFNYTGKTLHSFDGKVSRTIDIGRNQDEEIKTLKTVLGQSKILLATTQRLLFLNPDGTIENVLSLKDFESTQALASFQSYLPMTDSEIMVQANTESTQKIFFSIDLSTGKIKNELEFEKIIGPFHMSRSLYKG
jgi:hypothetical protein